MLVVQRRFRETQPSTLGDSSLSAQLISNRSQMIIEAFFSLLILSEREHFLLELCGLYPHSPKHPKNSDSYGYIIVQTQHYKKRKKRRGKKGIISLVRFLLSAQSDALYSYHCYLGFSPFTLVPLLFPKGSRAMPTILIWSSRVLRWSRCNLWASSRAVWWSFFAVSRALVNSLTLLVFSWNT